MGTTQLPAPEASPNSTSHAAPSAPPVSEQGALAPGSPSLTLNLEWSKLTISPLVLLSALLLGLQFVFTIVALGLAAAVINQLIDGSSEGNNATTAFVLVTLISETVGLAAIAIAAQHLWQRTPASLASDVLITLVDLALSGLAFGFACKEADVGDTTVDVSYGFVNAEETLSRGSRLKGLEAIVILLFLLKLFKVVSIFFVRLQTTTKADPPAPET